MAPVRDLRQNRGTRGKGLCSILTALNGTTIADAAVPHAIRGHIIGLQVFIDISPC